MRSLMTTAVCALFVLAAPIGLGADAEPTAERSWESYAILFGRNMFSRDRSRPDPVGPAAAVPEAPPPERYVMLRGIVRNGHGFVAVLEDMRSGIVIRAGAGEAVLGGKLEKVNLDGIRYVRGDATVQVTIGQNLEGGGSAPPAPAAPAAPGAAPGPGPSVAPVAPAPSGAPSDLLERLRRRRQEELGQ